MTQPNPFGSTASTGRDAPAGPSQPGPGSYGPQEQQLGGGFITQMQRSWPGVNTFSGFGTNEPQRGKAPPGQTEVTPGPGSYAVPEASHFSSKVKSSRSPWVGAARRNLGSRLVHVTDNKGSAVFNSPTAALDSVTRSQRLRRGEVNDAQAQRPRDKPHVGPGEYEPIGGIGEGVWRKQREIAQRGHAVQHQRCGFDSSGPRFRREVGVDRAVEGPGPADYAVPRWGGVGIEPRTAVADEGFLAVAPRYPPPHVQIGSRPTPGPGRYGVEHVACNNMGSAGLNYKLYHPADQQRRARLAEAQASMVHNPSLAESSNASRLHANKEQPDGEAIVQYLASGDSAAAIGTQLHRQELLRMLEGALVDQRAGGIKL